jgi:F-type H+-transporting ATPase subunit b
MLGRPILVLGFGVLVAALFALVPREGRAADTQQSAEGGGQVQAEAEPGHAPPKAADSHGGEEEGNPMEIKPTLTIWTVAVFLGLLLVLKRYAWGPLSEALHQREEHLEHCLLQAEKARNESEQLLAEHRRLMDHADDRARALLDQARKDAQASSEEIIKRAQAEAEAARERAGREIATARDQALAEIWSQTANMAVSVAGRVLAKELADDEHRRLLDLAIKELPDVAVATGSPGGARV